MNAPAPVPVVAIVGRPNVGKSTLFNQLTGTRQALVADVAGVTRDRRYGRVRTQSASFIVVDTGGMDDAGTQITAATVLQAREAVAEASLILLIVDAQHGLSGSDSAIAEELRKSGTPVLLVANKVDGEDERTAGVDFFELGLGEPVRVAARRGRGMAQLLGEIEHRLPPSPTAAPSLPEGIHVAVVGRPNVGKSTLINQLLGEQRLIASDEPGTTRDSIYVPFRHADTHYVLIDTAGVRRRARVRQAVEKYSVVQTLDAIERCHVVVLMLDASEGITDQDVSLLGHVLEAGRAIVVAINKWDAADEDRRERVNAELDRRLSFAASARQIQLSALRGRGIRQLMRAVREAYAAGQSQLSTAELTRLLEEAVRRHPPPLVGGRRIKLRFAHPGGVNPPTIVVHGNRTDALPDPYVRYLANYFSEAMDLQGAPVRMLFRSGDNPYAGRRNPLTRRQSQRRRRVIKHNRK